MSHDPSGVNISGTGRVIRYPLDPDADSGASEFSWEPA